MSDTPNRPEAETETETDPEAVAAPPANSESSADAEPVSESEPLAAAAVDDSDEPVAAVAESVSEATEPTAAAAVDDIEPVAAVTDAASEAAEPATIVPAAAAAAPKRTRPARPAKPAPPAPRPLGAYAIVETGGKQYRVSVGDRVSVEKLPAEAGSEITLDRVLLLGGNGATRVGTPTVSGAAVMATVEEHYRGEKIVIFKYKPKKRYRRRLGHRQSLTRLMITAISG